MLSNGEESLGVLPLGGFAVFPIDVTSAGTIRVSVGETGNALDAEPFIELFDPNGSSLGTDTGSSDAAVQVEVTQIGQYLAVVRDSFDDEPLQVNVRALTIPGTPELILGRDSILAEPEEFLGALPPGRL